VPASGKEEFPFPTFSLLFLLFHSFFYFFTPFSTFSLLFSLFPFEKVMKKEEKVHQKCPFSPYSK
jgi:hypothetical protein